MKFLQDCWTSFLELFNALTLSPGLTPSGTQQQVLPGSIGLVRPHYGGGGPVFTPPSHPQNPGEVLKCDYSAMGKDWQPCSSSNDRSCWLAGPGGKRFDINTDYETEAPVGTTRRYTLVADKIDINADGVLMPYGKVFDGKYPGRWIQACWGDTLEITVKNNLPYNGTTIHWHGLRQFHSMEMDGVNGVTQCPIAPGESYTYRFKATQYGSSWYHSHYSLQYGDGMAGPLTIHGPSSSEYDEPKDPILMTDWNHRSGFQDFQVELGGRAPIMDSILLNGQGSYAGGARNGFKFNTTFTRGKKYLLRLINTSVDTTFVFAIDHHNLTVVSSDFVPIQKYTTDHVTIGIGQRYHVVVEASPKNSTGGEDLSEAFWMRTIPATGCSNFQLGGIPDERQGIVYYKKGSTEFPTTPRLNFDISCSDEPFDKLRPVVRWTVAKPTDPNLIANDTLFQVGIDPPVPGQGHPLPNDAFSRWAIGPKSMYLKFNDPTVLNLRNKQFDPNYVVIPKDYPADSWIYMVIYSNSTTSPKPGRRTIPAAHPIHLHGHDFALLQQSNQSFSESLLKPKYDNPPRRDVVLLPANGFVAIAFKADNPGSWLLHCHIAWHASSGLAMQILERQEKAAEILTPERLRPVADGCRTWNNWFSNPNNLWAKNVSIFQDDSGI